MQTENISSILNEHPFLEGMDESFIETLAGCASNAVFHEGQYLFKEGDSADKFYLVRKGRVSLEFHAAEKGIIRIQTVGSGDVLGWSWLISPYAWHFDAFAVEDVRAFALDGKCLRDKCEKDHHFGYEMYKRFSAVLEQRLKTTRLQLMDFYGTEKEHKDDRR